ncbi:S-layer homology domain-containing protein [Paenibacillus lautus]|uniref:S-layer homology domain-containing protein n=1 Tax=Paenibacillus lautus TaxID=1401 RepID=UPI002DBD764C|nr:S-layer homology domain-containing protein [Paenibacillus lautus]MEC0310335.1 S-layer homology domain-containing protein [Paenibacillus lautus]
MKKTTKLLTAMLVTSSLLGAGAASAFSDIQEEKPLQMVKELQSKGIIQGVSADKFAPAKTITTAQAVQMIVNVADLKVQPNFTGRSFDSVPKDAWFADAVNIAAQNGLSVSADMKWNEPITREGFATLLSEAIQKTGNYPVVMMYLHVADEDLMKEESRGAVQFLLLTKIAKLDANAKFHPTKSLTRIEAAELAYNSIRFIEEHQKNMIPEEPGQSDPSVSTSVVKVDDAQNKVTVTKEDLPNPGYGIKITSVDYVSDTEAVIYYKVLQPDPDNMYPQVISKSSDDVLVPSKYTKITVKAEITLDSAK